MAEKIFIGGLPRSGTTMVQNILDSHPDIYGGPEFDRIPNIMDLRNKLLKSLKAGRISTYTSEESINRATSTLIDSLFSGISTTKKIKYISEKTPWNILFFEELFEVFPDAKYIMVLRNPLEVYNSMKQVALNAKKKNISPPDFTINYKIAVAYMEAVYKIMDKLLNSYSNNFYVIRYEALLNDLEEETVKLCEFVGVEWTKRLLDFNKIKHPGEIAMTKNEIWYTKAKFNADPNEVKKEKKKSVLTYVEKSFITYMFKKNKLFSESNSNFPELSLLARLISKLNYSHYKRKYRFNKTPKRVLP
mgnify:CR=1 FL=1